MPKIVKSGARPTEMRQRGIQPQGMERGHSLERRIPITPLPGQFHIHGRRFNANRLAPHFLSHPARRARVNERIENDSTFSASERNRIFHKILGKGSIVVFAAVLIFREDIPDIGYQCAIPLELYKVESIFSKLLLTRRQPSRVSMGSTNFPAQDHAEIGHFATFDEVQHLIKGSIRI